MKITLILALGCASAFGTPMSERISSDQLREIRSNGSPVASLSQQAENTQTVTRSKGQSLIKQSVIISDGINWTLVPQGAVLHTPEQHTDRINVPPVGNLISWKEFLALNYSWIAGEEISLRQAKGLDAIDSRRTDYWPKQSRVIVAVHRGGPISVSAPKPSPETAQNQ